MKTKAALPAIRAFFRVAAAWNLDDAECRALLGDPSDSTYASLKRGDLAAATADVIERVSHVLGIYKALQVLLRDPAAADAWVRRPNAASPFGGRSALELMLSQRALGMVLVRQYLEAEAGL